MTHKSQDNFWGNIQDKNLVIDSDNAISRLFFASVSKRVLVQRLSCENKFDLRENEPMGETQFHMNGFERRLVLTQRLLKSNSETAS